MPYEIQHGHMSCPASKPWAVLKKTDKELMGCHDTEDDAKKQMAALYRSEPDMHKPARRLYDYACRSLWAIESEYLMLILDIIERSPAETIEAVEARLGRPLENTRDVTMRDGIAVIPVIGPLVRYAGSFSEISGATSVQALGLDFNAALDNPQVRGIVMTFDSPGGEVSGINELADMIHAARGRKPMAGYIGSRASSGAYWIASALPHLVIDESAHAGNIGVVFAAENPAAKKQPPRFMEIVSDASPLKRVDVTTEEGQAVLRRYANEVYDVFAGRVAKFRNVARETVVQDFGRGANRIGSDAVRHHMADAVGSLEGVLTDMATNGKDMKYGRALNAGATEERTMSVNEILDKVKALVLGTAGPTTQLAAQAVSYAEVLVGRGEVNIDADWSISAAEENEMLGDPPNWRDYGRWFLGRDPEAGEETKAAYKYPHGKSGKVYRSALIAAKQRAAVQGVESIVHAASRLLDMIDAKQKPNASQSIKEEAMEINKEIMEENSRLRTAIAERDAQAAGQAKEAKKREEAETRARIEAEVKAFSAPLLGRDDLRFAKEEVQSIAALLTAVKLAAAGIDHTDAKALAALVGERVVKLVAGTKPLAPGGVLSRPADIDMDEISPADFASAATDLSKAQKIARVVSIRQTKEPKFSESDLLKEIKNKGK